MNGFPARKSLKERLFGRSGGGKIVKYLCAMRKYNYYSHHRTSLVNTILAKYYYLRYERLGCELGFTIGQNVFGYGLVIPHYGTIVVNGDVRAGNFCVLHTSTCIAGGEKKFGNGLYVATGAKILGSGEYGNAVCIGANSVSNNSAGDNVLLTGIPAQIKKTNYPVWYKRDGEVYKNRVDAVETLRAKMGL